MEEVKPDPIVIEVSYKAEIVDTSKIGKIIIEFMMVIKSSKNEEVLSETSRKVDDYAVLT